MIRAWFLTPDIFIADKWLGFWRWNNLFVFWMRTKPRDQRNLENWYRYWHKIQTYGDKRNKYQTILFDLKPKQHKSRYRNRDQGRNQIDIKKLYRNLDRDRNRDEAETETNIETKKQARDPNARAQTETNANLRPKPKPR